MIGICVFILGTLVGFAFLYEVVKRVESEDAQFIVKSVQSDANGMKFDEYVKTYDEHGAERLIPKTIEIYALNEGLRAIASLLISLSSASLAFLVVFRKDTGSGVSGVAYCALFLMEVVFVNLAYLLIQTLFYSAVVCKRQKLTKRVTALLDTLVVYGIVLFVLAYAVLACNIYGSWR